ncbi:hypothetical protein Tsubulata_031738 [Turnera subulata]|uniref:Uncharacterized protein n=1 Tax=Turnera subulata TaxID=218843 RepID=A0A9Q0FQD7_9ROSI|nr:hypothetical protein Tsubulata_031738 [Turnera subulata]
MKTRIVEITTALSATTIGGKSDTLSSATIYSIVTGRSSVRLDSSALGRLSPASPAPNSSSRIRLIPRTGNQPLSALESPAILAVPLQKLLRTKDVCVELLNSSPADFDGSKLFWTGWALGWRRWPINIISCCLLNLVVGGGIAGDVDGAGVGGGAADGLEEGCDVDAGGGELGVWDGEKGGGGVVVEVGEEEAAEERLELKEERRSVMLVVVVVVAVGIFGRWWVFGVGGDGGGGSGGGGRRWLWWEMYFLFFNF